MPAWQVVLIVMGIVVALAAAYLAWKGSQKSETPIAPPPPAAVDNRRRGTSAGDALTGIIGAGAGAVVGYLTAQGGGK